MKITTCEINPLYNIVMMSNEAPTNSMNIMAPGSARASIVLGWALWLNCNKSALIL